MKELLPICTNRLRLIETSIEDIDLILKMDKQEDTQRFLGGVKHKNREERLEFLSFKKHLLTVLLDGVRIGFVGLKINEDKAEISYIFDSDFTGKGYCSEIVSALVNVAFTKLNLNRVFAYTKKDNIASIKVLTKNGFINRESDNKDFIYYELLRGDV